MTATYDPTDPKYFDPAALREEVDRSSTCATGAGCASTCARRSRRCSRSSTPTTGTCWRDRCRTGPGRRRVLPVQALLREVPLRATARWQLDFPRLMSRVHAARQKQGVGVKERLTDQFLARTDALGRASVAAAPVVNWATGTPGSWPRRVMEKTVGLASERLLPPYAKQRFTTWFNRDGGRPSGEGGGAVSVFPTCFVEYMEPDVGRPSWRSTSTTVSDAACRRAPSAAGRRGCTPGTWTNSTRRPVATSPRWPRRCGRVGRDRGPADLCLRGQAGLPDLCQGSGRRPGGVAHLRPGRVPDEAPPRCRDPFTLRDEFPGHEDGSVPDAVTYHVACHLQAQNAGLRSRDLLKAAGVGVRSCSAARASTGHGGTERELQAGAPGRGAARP